MLNTEKPAASDLKVLLSAGTLSRRRLLASLAAAGAFAGAARRARAAQSLTSLTYSGQRWGMVQEAVAPQFTKDTGNPG